MDYKKFKEFLKGSYMIRLILWIKKNFNLIDYLILLIILFGVPILFNQFKINTSNHSMKQIEEPGLETSEEIVKYKECHIEYYIDTLDMWCEDCDFNSCYCDGYLYISNDIEFYLINNIAEERVICE